MGFRKPLDEFPIARLKQFLLVRRARRQFNDLRELSDLLAGARAKEMELNAEPVPRGLGFVGLRGAKDAQRGAGGKSQFSSCRTNSVSRSASSTSAKWSRLAWPSNSVGRGRCARRNRKAN